MDDTASFSSRGNAKRAAEQMISKGTAPALDYGIKPCDDGRFEIAWKTAEAKASPTTTDEVEAELAAAIEEAEANWSEAGEAEAASITEDALDCTADGRRERGGHRPDRGTSRPGRQRRRVFPPGQ
jgi:hypothetical protein